MANETTERTGPIPLPMPVSPAVRTRVAQKKLVQRLGGHTTNAGWLPRGLHPELDELAEEHRRLCARASAELTALVELARRYKQEDEEYASRLRDAFRAEATPPSDERTPTEERQDQVAKVEERLWSVCEVLADYADDVVAWLRRHETDLLSELKGQVLEAEDRARDAQALVEKARTAAFRAQLQGQWVQQTADDLTGRQPTPNPQRAPAQFVPAPGSLERPFHRRRDWAGKTEKAEEVAA